MGRAQAPRRLVSRWCPLAFTPQTVLVALFECMFDVIFVCCFVLLTRYWGIVTVPRFPRVNRLQIITWVRRILTLHLNYLTGYTGPLLFLFERTHNYYVGNQGLVPWRLRCLGRSKVRSASMVKVLS